MEILKCYPIYKELIWGGKNMEKVFGRQLPSDKIGESWDLSCRHDDMSIISEGQYKDKQFIDVINSDREYFLGSKVMGLDFFPLLIKIIDANDALSVQVHPDDDFANKYENLPYGKSEMWYIESSTSGKLIGGVNVSSKDEMADAIKNNTILESLNYVDVKKGSVIDIPAGFVHAITKGTICYEIQQNSDTTYRLYDYNRKDKEGNTRELHVGKGVEATKIDLVSNAFDTMDMTNNRIIENHFFKVDLIKVNDELTDCTNRDSFYTLTCVDGKGEIKYGDKSIDLIKGETIFIPAGLGSFHVIGNLKYLKAYL